MAIAKNRIVGILLAAGAGSRFGNGAYPGSGAHSSGGAYSGSGKLMHPLDGVPIGVRAARNLQAAGLAVTAVVRPGSEELKQMLEKEGCTVTVCANAAEGMGVSLAHAIGATRGAAGWAVALADMPRIQPATITQIVDAVVNGALIAAPRYRGERGHPVGFDAALLDELLALMGDEGARAILKRRAAEIRYIDSDDSGVIYDIDSRADLNR